MSTVLFVRRVIKPFLIIRYIRKIFYLYWNRLKFNIYGAKIGHGFEVYTKVYVKIAQGSKVNIGNNLTIYSGDGLNPLCRNIATCICAENSDTIIKIGNDCGFSSPCIWAKKNITIGNNVAIGGDTIIMDSDAHSLDYRLRASHELMEDGQSKDVANAKTAPIVIEDNVLIGTRCIVLKGVTIGARSVIAAGSIVTKSIPADCIAGGNPAKVIRRLE